MRRRVRSISTHAGADYEEECGVASFDSDFLTGLMDLHGEFGDIKIAAISDRPRKKRLPVDIIIEKYNADSWPIGGDRIKTDIIESGGPTVVSWQYEGGLIPLFDKNGDVVNAVQDENGKVIDGETDGSGYLDIMKQIDGTPNTIQLVHMHTVTPGAKASRKHIRNVRGFARHTDGLIVMIEDAKKTLTRAPFNIPASKVYVVPHGVRENNESEIDGKSRLDIPKNQILASQPGLQSLNKGNDLFIKGCAEFIHRSLTPYQRERFAGCLAGEPHPSFVKQEHGRYHELWQTKINQAIRDSNIKVQRVKDIREANWRKHDLIMVTKFLPIEDLLGLYSASTTVVTPYPDLDQVSSGAGADCEGPGTPLISTKTRWACETLNPSKATPEKGMYVTDRGILIEYDEEQLAQGLDYIAFQKGEDGQFEYIKMGNRLYRSGLSKSWPKTSEEFLKIVRYITREKTNGRTKGFKRSRNSSLDTHIS